MQEVRRSVVACVTLVMSLLLTCQASTNESKEQATYDQRQQGDLNVHVHVSDVGILAFLDESLFGEYGQYDYSYDYTDPVDPDDNGKPSNSTTASSTEATTSTSTSAVLSTEATNDDGNTTTSTTQSSTETLRMNETISANSTDSDCTSTTKPTTTTTTTTTSTKTTIKITKTTLKPKPKNGSTVDVPVTTETQTTPIPTTMTETTRSPEDPSTTPKSLIAMLLPVVQTENVKKQNGRRRCGPGYVRDNRGRCRRVRKPNYQVLQRLPFEFPFGIRLSPRTAIQVAEQGDLQ